KRNRAPGKPGPARRCTAKIRLKPDPTHRYRSASPEPIRSTTMPSEFIDIIEWTDDSRDTLSYRFPDDDRAIKRGAQLIVRESQVAQFVYLGEFGDTFGPGKHTLTTDNIPVLTKLKSWKYGFNSPFKADVYYVVTRVFTVNNRSTQYQVMLRDAVLRIVSTRGVGSTAGHIVS